MKKILTAVIALTTGFSKSLNYAPEMKGNIEQKPFVVVIASYNNENFYEDNLSSVFKQNYTNFRVLYTNDASTDKTGELVQEYVNSQGSHLNFSYLENTKNRGALHNIYHMIMSCKNDEIIVILDGDDKFAHPNVLNRLNRAYADDHVWVTYGQDAVRKGFGGHSKPMPIGVLKNRTHRNTGFCWSHLRTFYAGLFKLVPSSCWKNEGLFYPTSSDVAMMLFLIDLAGEHVYFIPDILCYYNNENPLNDYKLSVEGQGWYRKHIWKLPPLRKIQSKTEFL